MAQNLESITPTPEDINIAKIRERLANSQGETYWRSLDALADTDEFRTFMHKEFPREAAPLEDSLDRRDFMKLLGASMALAGLTSCVRPVKPHEKIMPYVRAPEEIIPGKPLFFATAITQGGYALGLLAESHQGRPTKVEGNPDHPASLGATDAVTQATVLSLYDPDRSISVRSGGNGANWEDAVAELGNITSDGTGLSILTETVTSPTLAQQLSDLQERMPNAKWHQYDVMHADNAHEGAILAFGEAVHTRYDFTKADVILSLGADFLGSGPGKIRYSKDFSRRRRALHAEDGMNRFYQVESTPSITGVLSDHRISLKPSQMEGLAREIAAGLGVDISGGALPDTGLRDFVESAVQDLQDVGSAALVVAGDEQAPAVHALAHAMNAALGNVGSTVIYTEPVEANPVNHINSLNELISDINAGDVQNLLIIGGNPVYTAPADLDFAAALAQVPFSLHLSQYVDETSALTTWHVPHTHYLETWSDARAFDGTTTIMQPLISPFYGGKSEHELLAVLMGDTESSGYDIVRSYWEARVEGDFDSFWRSTVYAGVVEGSEAATVDVSPQLSLDAAARASEGLEIQFKVDSNVFDGRYTNNGWLQELPRPFSTITWDNAALVAPSTAEELGISNNKLITLRVGEREVVAPVWILPGQAKDVITVHLGYGREAAGQVGGGVGFNAYQFRTSDQNWSAPLELGRASGRHKLIVTQVHHEYDGTTERRHIIRHGTLAEFQEHPDHPEFVHPVAHHESDLYPDFEYDSYAWAMVIDMTVCTGCNACVTACQAENNIPIVGKDQVEVGREMHWIRIDTYYSYKDGDLDNPKYHLQPVTCMHCEKAPCEPVCPFGATVHDSEGLNVMVYNRCGGTRYCANNCPYKVRRYNFLQYAELETKATELSLAMNPDVTVRSRGIMEKCTYCTQRIQQAYITSENEERRIRDGEIVTACQGACPTEAIVFGDKNDPSTAVSRFRASPLNYALLEELNTVPRTTYLAKLTNPNPNLAETEGI